MSNIMTLFERIKAAAAALTTKTAVAAPVSAQHIRTYSLFLGQRGTLTPRECWQLYLSVGTFAKTIDIIADNVASLKPQIKVGGEIYEQHPVIQLLDAPGYGRTRRRLIKELAVQYLVCGTCYTNVIGNLRAAPVALDVLRGQHLTITEGPDGWPGMYQLNESFRSATFNRDPESQRDPRWIDGRFSQIVPIFDMEGDQRGVGLSRLQSVQEDVNLKLTGLQHNRSLLANGATLSGIVHIKGNLQPDQKAAAREEIQGRMTGSHNAGNVMMTTGGDGLDFKQMMQSNKDMDWANLIQLVDDSIIARYSVPTTLFNSSAQTYDNYKEAWRALYENAVLPTFETIYGGMARTFSERFGEVIEIEHDKLTNNVLADAAVDRASKLLGDRMITVNEAREIVGYEPLAGGDNIYDLPGMIPQYEDVWTGEGLIDDPEQPAALPKPEAQAGKAAGQGSRSLLAVVS
jgi:HK97 family phage portal protein